MTLGIAQALIQLVNNKLLFLLQIFDYIGQLLRFFRQYLKFLTIVLSSGALYLVYRVRLQLLQFFQQYVTILFETTQSLIIVIYHCRNINLLDELSEAG